MRFAVKDTLTEEEVQSGLRAVIKVGLAGQAMIILTGGIFLVAFALELGASYLVIGLLAAIPPLAQLAPIEEKPKFFTLILQPFKDTNFKNLIIFLGSWNFAVNLAAPFFTVYLFKRLEFLIRWQQVLPLF